VWPKADGGEGRAPAGLPTDPSDTFDPSASPGRLVSDTAPTVATLDPPMEEEAEASRRDDSSPFRLSRLIGRGGFGEVWEATQLSLGRTVAVKRLRRQVAGSENTAVDWEESFRHEALTAAALEHPNIVPVYDLGRDGSGHQQLAQRLVRGLSWKALVDADRSRPIGELLARHLPTLIDVAQAVAFAHSKGILHRDLKPSQVLVGEYGEVFLVDWGLAFRFGAGAGETVAEAGSVAPRLHSSPTETTVHLFCPAGTPAYMAPEQTDQDATRLGPWTDVYLLGGTLYYLLTGSPPHPGDDVEEVFSRARAGVVEEAPLRELRHDLPEALVSLARRALAPPPTDRPSCPAFIAALRDYLSGTEQRRESEALTRSVESSLEAASGDYGALSECLADLARARGLWRDNPRVASLRERALADYGRTALAHGDLELARRLVDQLQPGTEREELGAAVARRAERHRRAARQRRFFLRVSVVLGLALVAFGVKYAVDRQQAERRLAQQRNQAVTARAQAEELMAFMLEDLTQGLERLGRLDLLDQVASKSVDYYDSFAPDSDDRDALVRRSLALRNIGRVLLDQGELERARAATERSLALVSRLAVDDPDSSELRAQEANRHLELGDLLQHTEDLDAALLAHRQGVTLYESLLAQDPEDPEGQRELARGLAGIGFEMWARADFDASLASLQRSVELLEALTARHPDDERAARLLLTSISRMGDVRRDQGELGEAAALARRALTLSKQELATDPGSAWYLGALSQSASSLGFTLWRTGDLKGALAAYREALETARRLAERDPTNQSHKRTLASAYSNVGEMLRGLGDLGGAIEALGRSIGVLGPLARTNPSEADWHYVLAGAYLELGTTQDLRGRHAEAREAWRRATETIRAFARSRGDIYIDDVFARSLLLQGRIDEARPVVEELRAKGWESPSFLEACRRAGLLEES
jgi:serine/threonine protein kinase/tetratricopeptide (TPR) repeat protein